MSCIRSFVKLNWFIFKQNTWMDLNMKRLIQGEWTKGMTDANKFFVVIIGRLMGTWCYVVVCLFTWWRHYHEECKYRWYFGSNDNIFKFPWPFISRYLFSKIIKIDSRKYAQCACALRTGSGEYNLTHCSLKWRYTKINFTHEIRPTVNNIWCGHRHPAYAKDEQLKCTSCE